MGVAVVTEIVGAGTPEAVWRPFLDTLGLAPFDLSLVDSPVVVAPHPDDEILGVGGILALSAGVDVIAVTDGEASHPDSTVYGPSELARLRRKETSVALNRLGQGSARVHRLGQPDGGIDEDDVAEALEAHLSEGRWCLATWRHDGHPDHERVGRAAARACAVTGARLIEYPIWAWHWAGPGDARIPWDRARLVALPPAVLRAKESAIGAFRTQVEPLGPEPADAAILPPHVCARFLRPYEVVFT